MLEGIGAEGQAYISQPYTFSIKLMCLLSTVQAGTKCTDYALTNSLFNVLWYKMGLQPLYVHAFVDTLGFEFLFSCFIQKIGLRKHCQYISFAYNNIIVMQ